MGKYRVGDKVVFTEAEKHTVASRGYPPAGTIGTIAQEVRGDFIWIQWPKGSTSCDDKWIVHRRWITPYRENKVIITTDGCTTTARMYEGENVVKEGVAECAPDDMFDFETGAKLAFERLMDELRDRYVDKANLVLDGYKPEPENFSGKVTCVECEGTSFMEGKTYWFAGGYVKDDNGRLRPRPCANKPIETLDCWNKRHGALARFVEFRGEGVNVSVQSEGG